MSAPHLLVAMLVAMLATPLSPASAAARDCLDLLYFERPPYYQREGDGVGGLVGGRASEALAAAGLCAHWQLVPATRHLLEVERNDRRVCAVGWFRTPARERIGQFSAPLYRDRPLVAVARADLGLKSHYSSAAELLSRGDLMLGVRARFSYGSTLDGLIEKLQPKVNVTNRSNAQQLAMAERGRIDYVFMAREEADYLLSGERGGRLALITFDDLPEGNSRYLLCSRRVPAEWMRRIDAAIRERWPG